MPRTKNQYFLHKAVEQNRIEMVKWLIENGAEVNAKNTEHRTPLHCASNLSLFEVVQYLIENGANVNAKDKDDLTPLHDASFMTTNRSKEILKYLLENGAQIDAKTKNGLTPLHYASHYGQLDIVKYLIEKGAQIEAKTTTGQIPLHLSASCSQPGVVRHLIEKGTSIDAKDNDGNTALHNCINDQYQRNYKPNIAIEVIKILIENGACIDQKAMDFARHKKILEYLTLKQKEILNAATPEETVSNKDPCIICNGPKNGFFILLPCAHGSLCEICCIKITKEKFAKCPQCRQPVKQYKKIFL